MGLSIVKQFETHYNEMLENEAQLLHLLPYFEEFETSGEFYYNVESANICENIYNPATTDYTCRLSPVL